MLILPSIHFEDSSGVALRSTSQTFVASGILLFTASCASAYAIQGSLPVCKLLEASLLGIHSNTQRCVLATKNEKLLKCETAR